ncbi:putative baseplate assembly protein [[Limnothrix rosea] IAM M-220]|nr:putative baseplate assembly protein [[Limnothrix rosea] IAM M-220]
MAAETTQIALDDLISAGITEVWVKRWSSENTDAGKALIRIFGHMITTVSDRLNHVPEKNFLSFLDLIGSQLKPPEAARVPVTFQLAVGTKSDVFVPEHTPVAAPPSEDQADEIVFETDRPIVLTSAQLQTVWMQDPRHQTWGDRLAAATGITNTAYEAFAGENDIPHYLYVSCPEIFALEGLQAIALKITAGKTAEAKQLKALEPTWQIWQNGTWQTLTPARNNVQSKVWNLEFSDVPALVATEYRGQTAQWLRATYSGNPDVMPTLEAIASTATIVRENLLPGKALQNDVALDLTKDFYPFGEESALNDAFYVQLQTESVHPGGKVKLEIDLSETTEVTAADVTVQWELGDGLQWRAVSFLEGDIQFYGGLKLTATLTLPEILPEFSTVDGEAGYWLRARIIEGFFGILPKARRYPIYDELTIVGTSANMGENQVVVDSADILEVGDMVRLYPITTGDVYQYPEEHEITAIAYDTKTISLDTNLKQSLAVGTRVLRKTIATETPTPIHEPPQVKFLRLSYDFTLEHDAIVTAENDFGYAVGIPFQTQLARSAQVGDRHLELDSIEHLDVGEMLTTPNGSHQIIGIMPPENRVLLKTAIEKYTPKYSEIKRDFRPFVAIAETEPTLYLGFSQPFSNNTTTLYFQIDPPDPDGSPDFSQDAPQLVWEYSSPQGWQRLGVQDETHGFSQRGIVQFIAPADLSLWRSRDQERAWLRVRWVSGAFPIPPQLRRILTNTIWANQATTLTAELLGSSNNNANQTFYTRQTPVLMGQVLEVAEAEIPDQTPLAQLGKEPLDIVRNDLGEIEEIWVRWREVPDFYSSRAGDRHYTLDRQTGKIQFGDGQAGLIPPAGQQNIRLASYQTGGGKQGNIAANTVTQLKTSIPYVASVINLEAAGGGAEQEALISLKQRAPKQLRHRDRAVTLQDIGDLAYEASTEVARVKILTPDVLTPHFNAINEQFWLDPTEKFANFETLLDSQANKINSNAERDLLTASLRNLQTQAGSVQMIVLPQSGDRRPTASLGLLEEIRAYIESRAEASINVLIVPPRWQEVKVTAKLVPISLDEADRISQAVLEKLDEFLHPLTGGTASTGWEFGRYPHDSDLYALLQSLPEVDFVRSLNIELVNAEDETQTEDFDATTLIYSGRHNITLVSPRGGQR